MSRTSAHRAFRRTMNLIAGGKSLAMALKAIVQAVEAEDPAIVCSILLLDAERRRLTMGAAPSLVWASGWFFAAAFPLLIPVAIWIYTLVFAFSSLWFAHYCLAALAQLRARAALEAVNELIAPATGCSGAQA